MNTKGLAKADNLGTGQIQSPSNKAENEVAVVLLRTRQNSEIVVFFAANDKQFSWYLMKGLF